MAKAFVFKNPQLTVNNLTTSTSTVVGEENFAEDGITLNMSSDPREVPRFTGTDRFSSGQIDLSGTVATILEGDDIWKLFEVFKIAGIVTTTLANGTVGFQVGGGDVCASADELEVIIEDKCRDEADVQKRIKLTNVEFNAEDIEFALNNSDGITPEIAFYANADSNGVKGMFGFDDSESA
jgi:hypothetical protein